MELVIIISLAIVGCCCAVMIQLRHNQAAALEDMQRRLEEAECHESLTTQRLRRTLEIMQSSGAEFSSADDFEEGMIKLYTKPYRGLREWYYNPDDEFEAAYVRNCVQELLDKIGELDNYCAQHRRDESE